MCGVKAFQKTNQSQKTIQRRHQQKEFNWNEDGQMILDGRVMPGSHIDDLLQSTVKKRDSTLPGVCEFESVL